jgi:hypothetical protein
MRILSRASAIWGDFATRHRDIGKRYLQAWRAIVVAGVAALIYLVVGPGVAIADNWTMSMTVDNQYDTYFGDSFLTSPTFVGGDPNWSTTETWRISNQKKGTFWFFWKK